MSLDFTVYGTAKPAGSKRGFIRGGRVQIVDANPNSKPWKERVAQVAGLEMRGRVMFDCPVGAAFTFYRCRPKGHFNTKGELNAKGWRTPYPVTKPDVLKLARGVEDALSGIVYRDDAQIVHEQLFKAWGEPERVEISITEV